MTTRFEGTAAENTSITILHPGEEYGDDTVDAGELALVLDYDEAFVITGTPTQLRILLAEAMNQVSEAEFL